MTSNRSHKNNIPRESRNNGRGRTDDAPSESTERETCERVTGHPDAQFFDDAKKWVIGIVGAVLPTAVVLYRVSTLSGDDPQIAHEIIGSVNVGAFLGSLFFDAVQIGLVSASILGMMIWHMAAKSPEVGKRSRAGQFYVLSLMAVGGLGMLIAPIFLSMIISTVIVAIGYAILRYVEDGRRILPSNADVRRLVVFAGLIVPAYLAFHLFLSTEWIPVEAIKEAGQHARWGFVLSTSDTDTTVIYTPGTLKRIKNNNIEDRQVCPRNMVPPLELTAARNPFLLYRRLHSQVLPIPALCNEVTSEAGPRR